eukprot:scaffold60435_cov69-Cyclotella_meneghiniana.AAC.10
MGAGKNKSHRKKRISKHVLKAEEAKKQTQLENELISAAERGEASSTITSSPSPSTPIPSPSSDNTNKKVKDPREGDSYLSLWKHHRTTWKFNKNTQSWLLRHCYNADKVNKTTFALLVEYISQGGDTTRRRVEEDAKRRAIRYKEWEKKRGEGDHDAVVQVDNTETKTDEKKAADDTNNTLTEEEVWSGLNEHEKRKEYKRARKIMDALKDVREKTLERVERT